LDGGIFTRVVKIYLFRALQNFNVSWQQKYKPKLIS